MMMEIEIKVISSETIKPSSPTPPNLRHYQLSFLDQLAPPTFLPMVLFFPNYYHQSKHSQRLTRVKTSLSDALTLFYPLAGRIAKDENGYEIVECNDEGAFFVEAKAKCELSDVLHDPNPSVMNKFLSLEIADARVDKLPIGVQVTFFACGGTAVSLCLNHKLADGLSFFTFLNAWSALARGESGKTITPPLFGAAEIFPPRNLFGFSTITGMVKDKIVAKRFVFHEPMISLLRKKYANEKTRPSRVEALSSFLWHRFVIATKPRICTMLHAVNLRRRTSPQLPANSFGNITRFAVSVPSPEATKDGSYDIVRQVRDSIKGIDSEFVKKLQKRQERGANDSDEHLRLLRERLDQHMRGELVSFNFTSLCGFPIYDADFGWGKPAFVGSARLTYKNLVCLFDTKCKDGVEAWVNLEEQDMTRFEADDEIVAFVSPTTVKDDVVLGKDSGGLQSKL